MRDLETGFNGFTIYIGDIDKTLFTILFPDDEFHFHCYKFFDCEIVKPGVKVQHSFKHVYLLLLRLLYAYPNIHIYDGLGWTYHPLTSINKEIENGCFFSKDRLLKRKLFWLNKILDND